MIKGILKNKKVYEDKITLSELNLVASTFTCDGEQVVLCFDDNGMVVDCIECQESKEKFETESIRNEYSLYIRSVRMRMFQFGSELSRVIDEICDQRHIGEYPTLRKQYYSPNFKR